MELVKKYKIVVILGIVSIVLIIISFILNSGDITYLEPVSNLQEEVSLSKSKLKKINNNFQNALIKEEITDPNLLYLGGSFNAEDNLYIGRMVDSYPITYQFTINTLDNTVTILELAPNIINEEELNSNEAGFPEVIR